MIDLWTTKKDEVIIETVQGNYGYTLQFNLKDYTPPSGAAATLAVQKPSNAIATAAGSISGTVVSVTVTLQQTLEAGPCSAMLKITSGNATVQSFPIRFIVTPTGYNEDREISSDDWAELEAALAQASDAITTTALSSSPLPASLGGTGRSSLDKIYEFNAVDFDDVLDITECGCWFLTNAQASSIAHLPAGVIHGYLRVDYANASYSHYEYRETSSDKVWVMDVVGGNAGTWTAYDVTWASLASTPLAVGYGGTGRSNLDTFMNLQAVDFSNVQSIATSGIWYISSSAVSTIANLPVQAAGYLEVITYSSSVALFRYTVGQDVYIMQKSGGSYGAWRLVGAENVTPTFTGATVYSDRCTITDGGFYQIGKRVYVEIAITSKVARNDNTAYQYLSGFPTPRMTSVPLAAYSSSRKAMNAAVISGGGLALSGGAVAIDDSITISGSYLAS